MSLLMPKATAVWLLDNTCLTFEQIAKFCQMDLMEVQAIADGEILANIIPVNPVTNRQLMEQEIKRCEADHTAELQINPEITSSRLNKSPTAKYTLLNKRQNKPGGIAWLVKNYPDMMDVKICKLLGTTKPTIAAIRNKTHWNIKNITAIHPVDAGLCSQYDFDTLVKNENLQPKKN